MHSLVRLQPEFDSAAQPENCNCLSIQRHLRLTSLHHQRERKMAYEERDEAASLYIPYMLYMIITQTRCTVALFLTVISEESQRRSSASDSRPRERNLAPAQNAKSDPI